MGFYDGNSLWTDAIALFIIQVLLIVILSRVLHFFLSRIFREPMVIAELIAGILLGTCARFYLLLLFGVGLTKRKLRTFSATQPQELLPMYRS